MIVLAPYHDILERCRLQHNQLQLLLPPVSSHVDAAGLPAECGTSVTDLLSALVEKCHLQRCPDVGGQQYIPTVFCSQATASTLYC